MNGFSRMLTTRSVSTALNSTCLADFLDGPRLLVLAVHEPVPEHLLRGLLARRPQHGRPKRAVEPRDVLADEVDVGRPVFVERRAIVAVADAGDVRQQGVEPDVDGEVFRERNANPPGLVGPANEDVPQSLVLDQADDLVLPCFGLDEFRMLLV